MLLIIKIEKLIIRGIKIKFENLFEPVLTQSYLKQLFKIFQKSKRPVNWPFTNTI